MAKNNDKELFTVSEFAAMTNTTAETLRYYHRCGLLSPLYTDSETGYRYYSMQEYETVGIIRALQSLGIPLKEIQNYLKNRNLAYTKSLLENQYVTLTEKINQLSASRNFIEEKLNSIDSINSDIINDKIVVKKLKKRIGYSTDTKCENYRQYQHETAKLMENYDKNLFLSNSFAALCSSLKSPSFYSVVFNIDTPKKIKSEKIVLPKGDYITLQFNGTYEDSLPYLSKIDLYIINHGMKQLGNAILLCITDETFTNNSDEIITEIQIPIKKENA